MDYKDYFGPYASEVNEYLKEFIKEKESEALRITPVGAGLWKNLETFIEGGKRMRAGLVKLGYEIGGGKDFEAILPISVSVELIHGGLLVHDDVIDQDEIRHGRSTVHIAYQDLHKANYEKGDALHYGESMALMVGDGALFDAHRLIASSSFEDSNKIEALKFFDDFLLKTVYGEALDVDLAYRNNISEEEVLTITRLKTSYYSVIGPLTLGAIFAGLKDLKVLEDFGLLTGIAFQIQDDIIGLFGEVEKSGKSNTSDIKEGKNTLLFTQALERATEEQKASLQNLWGNRNITDEEAEEVRHIIKDSGALEYAQNLAYKYADEGKKVIPKITQESDLQEVLYTLADFIVRREK